MTEIKGPDIDSPLTDNQIGEASLLRVGAYFPGYDKHRFSLDLSNTPTARYMLDQILMGFSDQQERARATVNEGDTSRQVTSIPTLHMLASIDTTAFEKPHGDIRDGQAFVFGKKMPGEETKMELLPSSNIDEAIAGIIGAEALRIYKSELDHLAQSVEQ
jgi:hypothetical protein